MTKIHFIKDEKELNQVLNIRKEVFVNEQNVPIEREIDGLDPKSKHIILYSNNIPCGCARLRIIDDSIKIERVAILKANRGNGFGKKIISFCLEYASNAGLNFVKLHAQYHLRDFYSSFGFVEIGDTFFFT